MKFIHVADIHASRERLPQTLSILETLTKHTLEDNIDFIIFAGDFWDSTITATKGSGFSDIIAAIRKLEKYTYLYFIYGTPSHEPSGSLDAFCSDRTLVVSHNEVIWKDGVLGEWCDTKIICIPEPRRSRYISTSATETDNLINKEIKSFIKDEVPKPCSLLKGKAPSVIPCKNCIVVYHGEVKGAVYQNGVSASSPTAIPKELLQSLNADYYALGHIHLPQEVFPNAWYSGSACPKDFGEIHDGHYNLVTIENGETKVEQVSFELPMFETYYVQKYNKDLETCLHFHKNFTNKYLRVCFDCTKEERKALNFKQLQEDIIKRTNALSVKLEPNVIEGDRIVKSEIVKHKSIVEKMTEYAKERAIKIPKYAKELLQNIQDNTLAKLSYPQHSFELLSLSLRGAIGIRNGQHKEDFEINFENMEDGVICLVGSNGAGKTTITENCHPYPCMLTRNGTLKDHFYLKDSHRILVYKDENGLYYKISMLIDGKNVTGKVSYFVETSKDREVWHSLPDVDGSFEAYKEWVNNTFGSIDVFLRTAFFAKEQTKDAADISATTKGERMELLSKLAGTEQLKEVSVIAREQRKEVEKSADKIEMEIESFLRFEETVKRNEEDIQTWANEQKAQEEAVSALEKEVAELKTQDAEYQKVKAVSEANAALYEQYRKQLEEKTAEHKVFDMATGHKDYYDAIKENSEIIKRTKPIIEKKEKELSEKQDAYNFTLKKVNELKDEISQKELKLAQFESNIRYLKSQIKDVTDVCPTCGAKLSEHKKSELFEHVSENKRLLVNDEKEQEKIKEEIQELRNKKEEMDICDSLQKKIDTLKEDIQKLADVNNESNKKIENLTQEYFEYTYEEACSEANRLKIECEELEKKMDDIVYKNCVPDVSEELSEKEVSLKRESNRLTEIISNIKAAEKENERCKKELDTLSGKEKELDELKAKITAYNFIEETFSNNGIPAIELRESAPEIADITNKILKDSYGNKFEIRFGSTSELKAKRKVVEDFNIIVYDTENMDEKTIDLVSSGERIWIKQALFYAFSIVQMNRTGFNFRTRLIDESDGSLDGGLRPKYLKMVESAHHISNSRITVLITHSQEIKDIAQQIIEI